MVSLFFPLSVCLLGGLVQAALPQGFRAIFRDTVLFVWRRQCRAEKADSPVMLPKFKPDMKQRSYWVEPSYLLYDLEMIQPCTKCFAITRSSSYDYILRCRLESVSRVRYMNGSLQRTCVPLLKVEMSTQIWSVTLVRCLSDL